METDLAQPRKLTAKGAATRARIVDTAATLIRERGMGGTSMDDVRRAAGVSGSQLSHYFDDKAMLVRAVVASQSDRVLGEQTEQFSALYRPPARDETPAAPGRLPSLDDSAAQLDRFELLEAWVQHTVAAQHEDGYRGCPLGSLAGEIGAGDTPTHADLAACFERWGRILHDGLAAMQARGELRPDADPAALALGLLASLQGGLLLCRTLRTTAPLEAAMAAMLAHVRTFASPQPA